MYAQGIWLSVSGIENAYSVLLNATRRKSWLPVGEGRKSSETWGGKAENDWLNGRWSMGREGKRRGENH